MSRSAVGMLLLTLIVGCGEEVATIQLELESPPERVATLSVFAIDTEIDRVVGTTTVTRLRTSIPLGVPAERPLQIHAVARPAIPRASSIGPMPIYAGMTNATVPLGSGRRKVELTAHHCGVLTVLASPVESGPSEDVQYTLRGLYGARRLNVSGSEPYAAYLAVPAGEMQLEPSGLGGPPRPIIRGVYVPIEGESVMRVDLAPRPVFDVEPASIRIEIWDEQTGRFERTERLIVPMGDTARLGFRVVTADADGQAISDEAVRVRWRLRAWPDAIEESGAGRAGRAEVRDLSVDGATRVLLVAWVEGRGEIRDRRLINVLGSGTEPGSAERMHVDIDDPLEIRVGTGLTVSFIDSAGHYAREVDALVDFADSDPWLYLPRDPISDDRGATSIWVALPSAPTVGNSVIVRASAELADQRSLVEELELDLEER